MKPTPRIVCLIAALAFALLNLSACDLQPPDLNRQVSKAVAETLAAWPAPSPLPVETPQPTFTPFPTLDIRGLFCEYDFCIGHPDNTPFFVMEDQRDQAQASSYASGKLVGYRDDVFLLLTWLLASGEWNPQNLIQVITEELNGKPAGDSTTDTLNEINFIYQPIQPPANSIFSGGLVASWRCADRDFVWLAFTKKEDEGLPLLADALRNFRCLQK